MNNKTKSLRPKCFKNFIGQNKLVQTLKIIIKSSQDQNVFPDHLLFYGPPGLGKTTLAEIIAIQSKRKIIFAQGSLLVLRSDILTLFANVNHGDIIFIDEIHSINKNLEELIYSVLEDNFIDISVGPEGDKKMVRMKVQPFTLIGATTNIGKINQPIKDRFGLISKLERYSNQDLTRIIINSSNLLKCIINETQANKIASYSKGTPRIANRLLKRVIDFAYFYNNGVITNQIITKTFNYLSIFKFGLNSLHIEYLNILVEVFENKPASIDAIASILNEKKDVITNNIEADLLALKLIFKTSRGRKISEEGINYLSSYNANPFKIN